MRPEISIWLALPCAQRGNPIESPVEVRHKLADAAQDLSAATNVDMESWQRAVGSRRYDASVALLNVAIMVDAGFSDNQ